MTTELKKRLTAKDTPAIERACSEIEQLVAGFTEERRAKFKAQTDAIRRIVKTARQRQIRRGYCNFVNEYRELFLIVDHELSGEVSFARIGTWGSASCAWFRSNSPDVERLKKLFADLPDGEVTISRPSQYLAYLRIKDSTLSLLPKGFRLDSKQLTAAVNTGKFTLEEFVNWDTSLDDESDD